MPTEAPELKPPPNELLIQRLEKLLEDARSGELRSLVYVADGVVNVDSSWVVDPRMPYRIRVSAMLGELQALKTEFTLMVLANREDSMISGLVMQHD